MQGTATHCAGAVFIANFTPRCTFSALSASDRTAKPRMARTDKQNNRIKLVD
jgi:hypothetical protein